ncbi:translation initiation factor IF-2 N-terminal domain-containing protein [Nocardia donostiensis]|uniref:Ribonuclease E n=1 Tax=Nocardia donostiensis TaxID=1538463 RepID=A0A1W0BL09_9NOCA|nr:translation initiation factor IF-2 N-terminal domain-containing protein [Nocardia donostiensis]ONM46543.1 ribonuclease E [Nocardia donostiensis]OQS16720.1 ribonuclease E [Nocardia donostiensis]OQS23183.1 ribonuclease E [Nocardia donostiensis]
MADQEPLDTTSQDADQLPERIRVHALAKRLGVTSKRILAKLAELGFQVRSPQSNVERAVAESVRDSLTTSDEAASPAAAAEPATTVPGVAESAGEVAGAAAAADSVPQTPAEEPATGSGQTSGSRADTAAEHVPAFTGGLFASPIPEEPAAAEPVVFESAVVAAPLFLSPDAAAAEELRRQRRAEREAARVREAEAAEAEADTESRGNGETETDEQTIVEQQAESDDQPRRRRRGRRGRGRGRGEQPTEAETDSDTERSEVAESDQDEQATEERGADKTDSTTAAAAAVSSETEEPSGATESAESGEDTETPEGSSRRRRRRRRRKVVGESGADNEPADDDPPNTVVHEREPRNKSRGRATVDEVQGISGSTRLEAKRQRRRDGREAGRRRPPILTESEFLARREAVDRVMVVREKSFPGHPTATQVAVLEDNILVEHFVTNTGSPSMVGNVYLGKVQNVLPSMEAAFVDIGRGRNGVLYAGEVNWEAAGLGGKERKIEQALKPGDQVLVQVSKDPVGHKGARLTTQISLAGRFLVYVPGGTSTGISRKLPDTERKRLKEILREIVPADAGVIIRTASEGVSEAELTRDVERLQTTWRTIEEASTRDSGAPKTLYEEPDLLVKVIRDLFNEDFSKLVIEGERSWSTVENYIRTVAPDLLSRVSRHESGTGSHPGADVFETYRIDEQLAKALDRKVWLPSGGTLVIDRTEAMTVIDVNTGKFTGSGGGNLEETVTRNNLEAAEEIVRQMRLRDIGGMIVVDFIDMVLESNRDLVLRRLTEALGRDRTRHQVSEVTSLGLVQMTRKKLGTGLVEAFSTTCEHCHGRGILVHNYPVEPSAGEDGSGRGRETGSRRRRGRDKAAAPVTPAAQPGETPDEDAAVKRAHPVALAMAAHQAEETGAVEQRPDSVEAAEPERVATEAIAVELSPEAAQAVAEDTGRVASSAVDSADARPAETAAESTESGESGEFAEPAEQRPARARRRARSKPSTIGATAARNGMAAEAASGGTATDTGAETPAAAKANGRAVVPEPAPAPGRVTDEAVAATGQTEAAEPATTEQAQSAAEESRSGMTEPVARQPRRRRVARSAAAPAADSAGAVFVVGAEQPAAPAVDYTDYSTAASAAAQLPARKTRRRAAGRPAGPPVDADE